jgi:hypothetical protein
MKELIRGGEVDSWGKNGIPPSTSSLLQAVTYGMWKPLGISQARGAFGTAGAQCFGRLLSLLNPERPKNKEKKR